MGNELFVAKDDTPMQMDFPVVNSLKITLVLDRDFDCQKDCHHKDWQKSDMCSFISKFFRLFNGENFQIYILNPLLLKQ